MITKSEKSLSSIKAEADTNSNIPLAVEALSSPSPTPTIQTVYKKKVSKPLCKYLFIKGCCNKPTCAFRHEVGPAFWCSKYVRDRFNKYNTR